MGDEGIAVSSEDWAKAIMTGIALFMLLLRPS